MAKITIELNEGRTIEQERALVNESFGGQLFADYIPMAWAVSA